MRVMPLFLVVLMSSGAAAQDDSSAQFRDLYGEYYQTCMKDWDAATHMTKDEWHRTCQRLANERVKFRMQHGDEFKSKAK